jgi:hypothetical protein
VTTEAAATWDQTDTTREGFDAYTEYVRFDPVIAEILDNSFNLIETLGEDQFNEQWEFLWDGAFMVCAEVAAGRHTFDSMLS